MTRNEVLRKAVEGLLTWQQAADICGITPRHLRRLREKHRLLGSDGLRDGRAGRRQPHRITAATLEELCRLKREVYPDFSIRHFHEFATARHGLKVSYTMTRDTLQLRGLADKAPSRGKYRRKRERRPMRGMLLHLDASTHEWIAGLPRWDLNVMLDDADGRILYAEFVEQEGTRSTLMALEHVLVQWGRFCELYTDRGSHFATTTDATKGPDEEQRGQAARALKALGIRHILARSPEARGRSERCFGTIQGRLPQELRLANIRTYAAANRYLAEYFVPDFNRKFLNKEGPVPESAFVPIAGIDLKLLLSVQHERTVQKDNTVIFARLHLQLPSTKERTHFVRCPVTVHEMLDETIVVSYQGKVIARFTSDGEPLRASRSSRKAAS